MMQSKANQECLRAPCGTWPKPCLRAQKDLTLAELGQRFATLLERRVLQNIRNTDEGPPQISITDLIMVITSQDAKNAARDLRGIKEQHM